MIQSHDPEAELHPVDYICVTPEHLVTGRSVADGHGTLTLNGRQWAYCSAGLKNAAHDWKGTGGVSLASIRHADLPVTLRPS